MVLEMYSMAQWRIEVPRFCFISFFHRLILHSQVSLLLGYNAGGIPAIFLLAREETVVVTVLSRIVLLLEYHPAISASKDFACL